MKAINATRGRLQEAASQATDAAQGAGDAVKHTVFTTLSLLAWGMALGGLILFIYAPYARQRQGLWEQVRTWYHGGESLVSTVQRSATGVQERMQRSATDVQERMHQPSRD